MSNRSPAEEKWLQDHSAFGTPVTELEINKRMVRTDPDIICWLCGKPYKAHPYDGEVRLLFPDLLLHHLCDGTLAKL